MMARFYKRDPAAALDGMARLTLEQRGAYNTILDLMYLYERPLPDDDRYVAGLLNVDLRVWKRLKRELVEAEKLFPEGGVLVNLRATSELATLQLERTQRVAAGKLGGKSSAESRKNKGLAEATASTRLDKSRVDTLPNGSGGVPPPDPAEAIKKAVFDEGKSLLCRASGITPSTAGGKIVKLVQAARDNYTLVLKTIRQACAETPTPADPFTWILTRVRVDRPKAWQSEEAARSEAFNEAFEEVFGRDA